MSDNDKPEAVNHPAHYQGKYDFEVIDVIESYELGFHLGNSLKYLLRAGKKPLTSEREDLEKSIWYIRRRISQLEGEAD